jgi:ubiquinone/menaquinone biosynthesis C-methylase UbiE
MSEQPNYFADAGVAERYAAARPYFHPLVVERLRAMLPPLADIKAALDVGCGTGQSSVALAEIAQSVTGIDNAAEMLAVAMAHERVQYIKASAEELPFPAGSFDLCTVGLALHWFDIEQFLTEAGRVLGASSWLAIYNDSFGAQMVGNPDFASWNAEYYVCNFPTPPRNVPQLTDELALRSGFVSVGETTFEHLVEFDPDALVTYLTTQSNVAAVLGRRSFPEVVAELSSQVSPLFSRRRADFIFRCSLRLFRQGEGDIG